METTYCILLSEFLLPGYTLQLDLVMKKWQTLIYKNITYFLNFSGLLRLWSLREMIEEIMKAYRELRRDLFTSTVSWDSALTFEHGCSYEHIYSRLTTHIKYFPSSRQPGTFCYRDRVRYYRSLISRSSHFSFQWVTTTCLSNLSTFHS